METLGKLLEEGWEIKLLKPQHNWIAIEAAKNQNQIRFVESDLKTAFEKVLKARKYLE